MYLLHKVWQCLTFKCSRYTCTLASISAFWQDFNYLIISPVWNPTMLHHNQLRFNLDMPSMPSNLAVRYRNPGPLVIEKLGGVAATSEANPKVQNESPVKFTALSEDRISLAIRLAKHDLKNMLTKNQTPIIEEPPQERKQMKKSKARRSPSGKSHRQLKDINLRVQERYRNPNEYRRSVETQTPKTKTRNLKDVSSRPVNAYGLVLNVKNDQRGDGNRWGQSNEVSSPSKDAALSPNSQQAREIKRLRLELRTYIKKVEELSMKGRFEQSIYAILLLLYLEFCK